MKSKAIFMALLVLVIQVQAVPVSVDQVRCAAQTWAAGRALQSLGGSLGRSVQTVEAIPVLSSNLVYAVRLVGGGTVLMTGDTEFEPVLAFSPDSVSVAEIDPKGALWALLNGDLSLRRSARGRQANVATAGGAVSGAAPAARWARLLADFAADPIKEKSGIDDLRVDALVKTCWGQSKQAVSGGGSANCFNYYTPDHCVCGCVATAFAQIMRHHCWPTNDVPKFTNTCGHKGKPVSLTSLGGIFDWDNMATYQLSSDASTREKQCQAIGRLTYECGIAVKMMYDMPNGSGSGAYTADVVPAMKSYFGYKNGYNNWSSAQLTSSETFRRKLIYPSLDAGKPVLFSITGGLGGHAVVADGYGYSDIAGEKLPFVHLNMGWTKQNDWWYNLPNIDVGDNPESFTGFDTLAGIGYNIFSDQVGRIFSGRVLDIDGKPAKQACVTFGKLATKTSDTGVYAFIVSATDYPSGSYGVQATSSDGVYIGEASVSLGGDAENTWGCDIGLSSPSVRIGTEIYSTLEFALDAAQNGDVIEILRPTVLRSSRQIGVNCTIVATNEDAAASAVCFMNGAALGVSAGARVLFKNVSFTNLAQNVVIDVAAGGTAAVAGSVDVQEYTTDDEQGFELAGRIVKSCYLTCAGRIGAKDEVGLVTEAVSPVGDSAGLIRNKFDEELGGAVSGDRLVWQPTPVSDEAAVVRLVRADGSTANYLSLKTLFKYCTNEATIVICKNCAMDASLTVSNDLTLVSSNGTHTITATNLTGKAGFTVKDGTMTVSNVVFRGYTGPGFLTVSGTNAELVLASGAHMTDLHGTGQQTSGAVTVEAGTATLLSGCEIDCCEADYGGAVALKDWKDCKLNLFGGAIHDCVAKSYGGGVYAGAGSVVSIKGDIRVEDNVKRANESSPAERDNICFGWLGESSFVVVGALTSDDWSVGLYDLMGDGNAIGETFATVDDGAVAAEDVAAKFFCDKTVKETGNTLVGEAAGQTLVWKDGGKGVDPALAKVLVLYPDDPARTNYCMSVAEAFDSVDKTNEVVVALKEDLTFEQGLTVPCKSMVLRSLTGTLTLARAGDFMLTVNAGSALTIEDLILDGGELSATKPLVFSNGGTLVLANNAWIQNATSTAYATPKNPYGGAGVATKGGSFAMKAGSRILNCRNTYGKGQTLGEGGGLWTSGTRVVLEGASITGCRAGVAGGAYCYDGELCVSGATRIRDNANDPSVEGVSYAPNLAVNGPSVIKLTGDLAGSVGVDVYDGVDRICDVFGSVETEYLVSAEEQKLIGSAKCFVYDGTNETVTGCVVTNGTKGLLVWNSALKTDPATSEKYYEDDQGTRYGLVGGSVPPPTPVYVDPDPIAFKSVTRVSETECALVVTDRVQWAEYRLIWTDDLKKGFTTTGAWEQATAAGPWATNVLFSAPAPSAIFWKAEAQQGQKPTE